MIEYYCSRPLPLPPKCSKVTSVEISISGCSVECGTHPTDSARGLVEFSDTNTWQANLWSAGCLVMKPKYLREENRKVRSHDEQMLNLSDSTALEGRLAGSEEPQQ